MTGLLSLALLLAPAADSAVEGREALAREVREKGWIVYAARSEAGDWDLFVSRPDGSRARNITRTADFNEAYPLFSRDGGSLLYRRLGRDEAIDGNHHGAQGQLVLADSDGSHPRVLGEPGEFPWASWSPDGKQVACLTVKGITLVDLATRRVVRTLPRQGFFQQLTWSPDGSSLSGVANNLGTGWSVARMSLDTGRVTPVSRVDCCTPDWFPGGKSLVFSRRTGTWTQLWMADAEGRAPRLLYAEDGRHVYGGHVSPDGRYVLFSGNAREDGDPGQAGAPMGLMRLADAPILGGDVRKLEKLQAEFPRFRTGPVLTLPRGWEPCWTLSEKPAGAGDGKPSRDEKSPGEEQSTEDAGGTDEATALGRAVRARGWIAFSARSDAGDWDLFACRPDGSGRRRLTATPDFNEAGVRFSPSGRRVLYYRMPKDEPLDNNTYGTFELVVADTDGGHPKVLGPGCRWAAWGPDDDRIAYLTGGSVRVVELASLKAVREWPRKGIVQQLAWSPDGRRFAGTANGLGPFWNVARLDALTGEVNVVSETERWNCTPDWWPDSEQVVYSRGIIPERGGFAEIWLGRGDGRERRPLAVEAGRHLYGGCPSPDGRYLLFTRSKADLGRVDHAGTTLAIIRLADAPVVAGDDPALRARFPGARAGPRLDLGPGWEPHWTDKDIAPRPREKGTSR